ncbi:MAG: secondary thiamine-phosphate synthase enzyme YjbQ [Elusimicrobiota bacterium]
MIITKQIEINTKGFTDVINITSEIEKFVSEKSIKHGQVSVFVKGSTGAVTTIEYEPNLIKDFKDTMEKIAPSDKTYEHKKTWGDDNGHSHVRASIVGCSQTIAVRAGQLQLGTWQQVVVVDFDTCSRKRTFFLIGISQ